VCDFLADLRCVRRARAQDEHGALIERARSSEQVREALLPRDAADEEDVGPIERHAMPLESGDGSVRLVGLGVDAVVHDVHAGGVHLRVRRKDVATHPLAHRDDRLSVGVRRRLHP
jgi:hypothetical protein